MKSPIDACKTSSLAPVAVNGSRAMLMNSSSFILQWVLAIQCKALWHSLVALLTQLPFLPVLLCHDHVQLIQFKGQVKLSGILLRTLPSHFAHAPKQVKIFANRPGLSFDDATSDPADQQAELTEEHVRGGENGGGGKVFALRFVKFQKVDSLSIAVLSNQRDAETTRIDAIDVFGIADQTTDMSELQKIEGGGATRDMHFSKVSRTGLKGGSLSSSSRGGFTAQTSSSTPNTSTDAQQAGRHSRPHSTSSLNPAMPRYRRSGSSSCAPRMQHLDEEDQDEYVDDVSRRPSAQQQSGFAAHAPPSLTEEEEKVFQVAQNAARDAFRGWHYAPLGVALAPPLGALVGGHSDAWSDAILLILASFWLYQFLRVPWEIYYASMTRHVLTHDADEQEQAEESEDADRDISRGAKKKLVESHQHIKARQAASAELRRSELLSLIFCVTSPIVGAYMLHWMRETMTDGNKYLNTFNIRLFTMAAGIKPWSHAIHLIQRRMLHLQEQVHYPSSKVEKMSQRLRRIEADLSSLRKLYATKNDIRVLREHEAQLGRAVRRSERKEEYLRLSAEEKFSIVEGRLEDLLHEVAINAELIEQERKERERAASLRISLFEAVKYLLGSGLTVRRASPKHYLHDLPRSLPSTAALGIGSTSADADAHLDGAMKGGASLPPSGQTFSPNGPPRLVAGPGSINSTSANRKGSPPSNNGAGSYSSGSSSGDAPQPQRSNSAAGAPRSRSRGAIHHVSDPWWERGVAFYLFFALNVSSAAIRFASEKVKHILQDSGNKVARNQRKTLQYQKHLADEQLQQQQQHHHRKQQH